MRSKMRSGAHICLRRLCRSVTKACQIESQSSRGGLANGPAFAQPFRMADHFDRRICFAKFGHRFPGAVCTIRGDDNFMREVAALEIFDRGGQRIPALWLGMSKSPFLNLLLFSPMSFHRDSH